MATAQIMEEELQQSVMISDAEYETADSVAGPAPAKDAPQGENTVDVELHGVVDDDDDDDDDEELSDRDASGEDLDEDMDHDAEGEEETGVLSHDIVVGQSRPHSEDEHDEHDEQDEEEDEEEDEEDEDEGDEEDEEEDEDDPDHDDEGDEGDEGEGVGAVKIKPRDGGDSDNDSDVSDLPSAADEDSDEEPAWEEAEEVGRDEEDEESETSPSNVCIFCKQDEEHDPSEDFETFLICAGCKDNAHQQCARDAAAMSQNNGAQNWKCPECDSRDSELDAEGDDLSVEEDVRHTSQQSTESGPAPKIHDDDADVQSFNSTTLNEESVDGQRVLRKRKTSSVELDETALSLRRRRRNPATDTASATDDVERKGSSEPGRGLSRTVRIKASRPSAVVVERRSRTSLLLKIQVRPGNLKEILGRKKRERRRSGTTTRHPRTPVARRANNAVPVATPFLPTPFTTELYSQPFYSFFDKETDDMKGKPYGGILTEAEADTSKTLPQPDDRRRFDQAKQRAEDEWRARVLAMQAEVEVPIRKSKKSSDHASQIECIEFGGWEIDTWYAAPYPAEYSRNRVLYICEFCLKYMNSDYVAWRHKLKCSTKHPPGDEIYRHGSVSMFEVDGRKNPVYCQNLCLLAKLFLGSKTLYYDVEPFLFYVLCEYDDCGYHFVGYFSKEKRASSQNNVSCILTLPIHQRKGYGNLLIDFSYLLTKVEEKTGSPEKPLSDMGLVSYRNYWRLRLCRYFLDTLEGGEWKKDGLSIRQISDDTGMTADDVIAALEGLRALVRDPQTKLYAFRIDVDYCRQYVAKWEAKGYVKLKPEALAWTPYVMGRSNAVNFELGPPINTIAPREDDEAKLDEGNDDIHGQVQFAVNGQLRDMSQSTMSVASELSELSKQPELMPLLSIEKVAAEDKENAEPVDEAMEDADPETPSWALPYRAVPPSRFELFPPVAGSRRADRSRQNLGRSSGTRATSTGRSRPKRAGGTTRRQAASRPRSSNTRRKTGGTGRGPGRWPKGTKKSDYGNADSGPGLPPGWTDKPEAPVQTPSGVEDEPAKEEVLVFVPKPTTNGIVVAGPPAPQLELEPKFELKPEVELELELELEPEPEPEPGPEPKPEPEPKLEPVPESDAVTAAEAVAEGGHSGGGGEAHGGNRDGNGDVDVDVDIDAEGEDE